MKFEILYIFLVGFLFARCNSSEIQDRNDKIIITGKAEFIASDSSGFFIQTHVKVKKGVVKKPDLLNDLTQPKLIQKKPYLFMAAAVSDYKAKYPQSGKLKKEQLGDEWCLEL